MLSAAQAPALFFDDPFYWIICSLMIVAAVYASIFFHELGHWLIGKVCGFRILGFSVGEGRMMWRGRVDRGFVHLRLLPVEGYVLAVKESSPVTKTQQVLLSAGGPLFTALCLATVAIGYHSINFDFLGQTWSILTTQMLSVVMVLLGISLLYNLWPHYGLLGGESIANDGMAMLSALLSKHYPEPPWYQAKLRNAFPDESANLEGTDEAGALLLSAWVHHWDERNEEALATARQALQLSNLLDHEQAVILSEAATFCPQTKPGLEQALTFNEQAYGLFPTIDHFACKLALAQISLRFYDRARRLLEEVLERATNNETRATALCTTALADAAQKRQEDGLKRLEEARKLSPYCSMVPLARAALLGGTPGFTGR